jgi:hypothetical protein
VREENYAAQVAAMMPAGCNDMLGGDPRKPGPNTTAPHPELYDQADVE